MTCIQQMLVSLVLGGGVQPVTIGFDDITVTSSSGVQLTGDEWLAKGIRIRSNAGGAPILYAFKSGIGNAVSLPNSPDSSVFLVGLDYQIQFLAGFNFTKLTIDLIPQQGNSLLGGLTCANGTFNLSYPSGSSTAWMPAVKISDGEIGVLSVLYFGSNAFVGIDRLVLA